MRRLFAVDGLACAGCARGLQRRLSELPGMSQARVHYLTASALLDWDDQRQDRDGIAAAVQQAGYRLIDRHRPEDLIDGLDGQMKTIAVRLAIALLAGMWSMALALVLYTSRLDAPTAWWLAVASGVFVGPVLWAGRGILWMGWKSMQLREPTMDLLVSAGTLGAIVLSLSALAQGRSEVWFDAAAMLITLLLLARLIDLRGRRSALGALLAMRDAAPDMAVVQSGQTRSIMPADRVPVGATVIVDAGAAVTVDGIVVEGHSLLNRAVLTGESGPVPTGPGDRVDAGSINLDRRLILQVDRDPGDREIDRLGGAIALEIARGGAEAGLAERWAAIVSKAIPLAALAALILRLAHGESVEAALVTALTVLVGMCPCALALAVPLVRMRTAGLAVRQGWRIREPEAFERLATVDTVVLDKTGTLTEGQPHLAGVQPEPGVLRQTVLDCATLAETGLSHPLARAITTIAGEKGGGGLRRDRHAEATDCQGRQIRVFGADALIGDGTTLQVTRDGVLLGRLVFADRLLPQAGDVLAQLSGHGLRLHIASGDATGPTVQAGAALGIDPGHIASGQTPMQKADLIRSLGNRTAFVGDGVNDAPALAASACGIAVASAHPSARLTADVVIEQGGIERLPLIFAMARRARHVGHVNLILAVIYNAGLLPLLILGHAGPGTAAIAMAASSLSVTANAARMRMAPISNVKAALRLVHQG